jgi:hypothetical protein
VDPGVLLSLYFVALFYGYLFRPSLVIRVRRITLGESVLQTARGNNNITTGPTVNPAWEMASPRRQQDGTLVPLKAYRDVIKRQPYQPLQFVKGTRTPTVFGSLRVRRLAVIRPRLLDAR